MSSVKRSEDNNIVLVITQTTEDEFHLKQQLGTHFDDLRYMSIHDGPEGWLESSPRAVVIACNSLAESERTYRHMLMHEVEAGADVPHRSVLMCQLEEAEEAYGICCEGLFDDYLVHKPIHDVWRIRYAVWQALTLAAWSRNPPPEKHDTRTRHHQRLKPRVMVVDDDEFTRDVYLEILEGHGFEVMLVDDGSKALATATQKLPNVIVMDVNMPGLDGIEATRQLRANRSTVGVPIIFASGRRDKSTVEACVRLGANAYITKPINEQKLMEKIRQHLPFERSLR